MSTSDVWTIVNREYDAHTLAQFNAVCTSSNGYLGISGNLQEDRSDRQPVTLINGVYDELNMVSLLPVSNKERRYLDPEHFDSAGKSPSVANLPSPLLVRVFVDDCELTLPLCSVTNFEQRLCLRSGMYSYTLDLRDGQGRTTRLAMTRFASMADVHRVYMRYEVTPLDHDAPIRVESGVTGRVQSNATGERQFHVTDRKANPDGRVVLTAKLPARDIEVTIGVQNVCAAATCSRSVVASNAAYVAYSCDSRTGETIVLDRFIALGCSQDEQFGAGVDINAELSAAATQGFEAAANAQQKQWEPLWQHADVQIDGDDLAQRYLRFCIFHALAAVPRHADGLSVPVKLLTGDYYQGNTFYDTDLYLLPLYTFTLPDAARGYLHWRHVGLEYGRNRAAELGYRGAKLAWQAGPFGEECLGDWYFFTRTNIHIDCDVAYALMQYYRATGDEKFLANQGIELLVETARFFASRAECDGAEGPCHIHDVSGPDEGHCHSTDNFFTNYLGAWNLRTAADMVKKLRSKSPTLDALSVSDEEVSTWRSVADRLALRLDPQTKVYEQYEGFYQLEPKPPHFSENREVWFETVFPYQALNQPDVLMALALQRDKFDSETMRANWEFYKDKSMNFSSMSFVVNAIMATEIGDLDEAYRQFLISAGMDIDESLTGRRDTYAGLHGTAAGGAWMAAVQGFGGVYLSESGLRINPKLPAQWSELRFNVMYRGQVLQVRVGGDQVEVTATRESAKEVSLVVAGQAVTLAGGETARLPLKV